MAETPENKLTDKQRAFVFAYVQCWNATEAARRAGYKGSDATLAQIGYENMRKHEIRATIESVMEAFAMSAGEVLMRLTQQARADMTPYLQKFGVYLLADVEAIKRDGLGHLIKKMKGTPFGVEVEFHDAQTALLALGKHHKLFKEVHEHTGKDGEPIAVEDARDQLARLLTAKAGRSGPEPDHQPDDAGSGTEADL